MSRRSRTFSTNEFAFVYKTGEKRLRSAKHNPNVNKRNFAWTKPDAYGDAQRDLEKSWEDTLTGKQLPDLGMKALKKLIRKEGIPEAYRREVWLYITGAYDRLEDNPAWYKNAVTECFGDKVPRKIYNVPTFGSQADLQSNIPDNMVVKRTPSLISMASLRSGSILLQQSDIAELTGTGNEFQPQSTFGRLKRAKNSNMTASSSEPGSLKMDSPKPSSGSHQVQVISDLDNVGNSSGTAETTKNAFKTSAGPPVDHLSDEESPKLVKGNVNLDVVSIKKLDDDGFLLDKSSVDEDAKTVSTGNTTEQNDSKAEIDVSESDVVDEEYKDSESFLPEAEVSGDWVVVDAKDISFGTSALSEADSEDTRSEDEKSEMSSRASVELTRQLKRKDSQQDLMPRTGDISTRVRRSSIDMRGIERRLSLSGGQGGRSNSAILTRVRSETIHDFFEKEQVLEQQNQPFLFLSKKGVMAAHRILVVLANEFPELKYCPVIPYIVGILLIYMDEAEAFGTIYCVLEGGNLEDDLKYVYTNQEETAVFIETFVDLVELRVSRIFKHVNETDINLDEFAVEWFTRFFIGSMPFQLVMRVMDAFFNEGTKVLYRVGLAILKTYKSELLSCNDYHSFRSVLVEILHDLDNSDLDSILKTGFSMYLSRAHVEKRDKKNWANIHMITSRLDILETIGTKGNGVYYRPHIEEKSKVFDEYLQFEVVWSWLPSKLAIKDGRRLFCTSIDGYSLITLFEKCLGSGPNILLIRTLDHHVFGCFTNESWRTASQFKYYGNGECFLFSIVQPDPEHKHQLLYHPKKYEWNQEAGRMFMMSTRDSLMFGAEDAAIWIDKSLENGSTYASKVFDSPKMLSTKSNDFKVKQIEVWGFV